MAKLRIETFCLGEWMTNCYVLRVEGRRECWIVDAGFEPQPMIRFIQENDLEPAQVVMTHAHVDHMAGLNDLCAVWPHLPILIHPDEAEFLTNPMLNLSALLAEPVIAPPATGWLRQGQTLELSGVGFEVRHTPGHSPGGISLHQAQAEVALVGDALFAGSIGRTDFPTSDHQALLAGIRQQLLSLPDATRVLPGHGPATTIGQERRGNPFL